MALPDPARLVADTRGCPQRPQHRTPRPGGNYPQTLVNRAALAIQAGDADLVLLTGAEAWRTRTAARKGGGHPDWTKQAEAIAPDTMLGNDEPLAPSRRAGPRR